jgi:hypothetical protein
MGATYQPKLAKFYRKDEKFIGQYTINSYNYSVTLCDAFSVCVTDSFFNRTHETSKDK